MSSLAASIEGRTLEVLAWAISPAFYAQIGLILVAYTLAYALSAALKTRSLQAHQASISGAWAPLRRVIQQVEYLLFPLLAILFLALFVELAVLTLDQSWLLRVAESLSVVFLLYSGITRFVRYAVINRLLKWLLIPIAVLHVFGWLDNVTSYLDTLDIQLGNIRLSVYIVARAVIFGGILFWLGRVSNMAGQRMIRRQQDMDSGTREVLAKLFQVALVAALFIVLLQIIGINLTTLAVFSGALGVGLAVGLQSIASNFISGLIILIDRSLKIGDHIELDDGRSGRIREINMRSTLLQTYDGKDIMVPNEQFISSRFTNWTHHDEKQRYAIEFQVAYQTDIPAMLDIVRDVVRSHPQVLDGKDIPTEELADAEISGFGDSGIDILVEYWIEGVDDGVNHVGADLLLMIWQALKNNQIEIPFPQREVRLLDDRNSPSA